MPPAMAVLGIYPAIAVSHPAVGVAFPFEVVSSGVTPVGMAVIDNSILGIAAAFPWAAFFGQDRIRQAKSQKEKQGNRQDQSDLFHGSLLKVQSSVKLWLFQTFFKKSALCGNIRAPFF